LNNWELQGSLKKRSSGQLVRYVAATACLTFLIAMAWASANAGLSRLNYRTTDPDLLPALTEIAVRQSPSDPDAHWALAESLLGANRFAEAVAEYEAAVKLRPRDYFLWMELGYALVQNREEDRAYVAYQTAAKLAPHYAQPRVRLGEFLLRLQRREEAFQQLRRAATSDNTLLPEVTQLAIFEFGDPAYIVQVLQPRTATEKMTLAFSFLKEGFIEEAVKLFHQTGDVTDADRKKLVHSLLQAKRYKEAHQVWSSAFPVSENAGAESIINGAFESVVRLDETGFGWQVPRSEEGEVSLSVEDPHSGRASLSISYTGESNPSTPAISQIVLVRPDSSYRLSYAARTSDLVTGGPPVVGVINAATNRVLAESDPLGAGSQPWRAYQLVFSTEEVEAVIVAIYRQHCRSTGPTCAAFGRVWFDSFRLVENQ
jgi:Flp pilus assembly protein TadD